MSASEPHDSRPPTPQLQSATRGDSPAPTPPRKRRSRPRVVAILLLLAGVLGWLTYEDAQQAPAEPTSADALALDAAGGWWNVAGDRYLELEWEGRRASQWDYSASESGEESTGSWHTTERTVVVQVSGPGGNLMQEFELIGNDTEMFLAPAPASSAKLLESWIADHGDDEEEVSPRDSTSREAVWQGPGSSRRNLVDWNLSRRHLFSRNRVNSAYRLPARSVHARFQSREASVAALGSVSQRLRLAPENAVGKDGVADDHGEHHAGAHEHETQ
jgi:hypothetical protein